MSFTNELSRAVKGLLVAMGLIGRRPILVVPLLIPVATVVGPIIWILDGSGFPESVLGWGWFLFLYEGIVGIGLFVGSMLMLAFLDHIESGDPPLNSLPDLFPGPFFPGLLLSWFWGFGWSLVLVLRVYAFLKPGSSSRPMTFDESGSIHNPPGGGLLAQFGLSGEQMKNGIRTGLYLLLPWMVYRRKSQSGWLPAMLSFTSKLLIPGRKMMSLFSLVDLTAVGIGLVWATGWILWSLELLGGTQVLEVGFVTSGLLWVLGMYLEQFAHGAVYLRLTRRAPSNPGEVSVVTDPDLIDDAIELENARTRGDTEKRKEE